MSVRYGSEVRMGGSNDSPLAMRMSVVPVSVIPAVEERIVVPAEPYVIDWSMPT